MRRAFLPGPLRGAARRRVRGTPDGPALPHGHGQERRRHGGDARIPWKVPEEGCLRTGHRGAAGRSRRPGEGAGAACGPLPLHGQEGRAPRPLPGPGQCLHLRRGEDGQPRSLRPCSGRRGAPELRKGGEDAPAGVRLRPRPLRHDGGVSQGVSVRLRAVRNPGALHGHGLRRGGGGGSCLRLGGLWRVRYRRGVQPAAPERHQSCGQQDRPDPCRP